MTIEHPSTRGLTVLAEATRCVMDNTTPDPDDTRVLSEFLVRVSLGKTGPEVGAVHGLLTGPYRDVLDRAGWDPDLIPLPPPRAFVAAVTLTPTTSPGIVALQAPAGHPLHEQGPTIGGAIWDGNARAWRIPITHHAALRLRTLLTGHPVTLHPDVASALKSAAETPSIDVTVAGNSIEIRFPHTKALQDDVTTIRGIKWDGPNKCWHTSTDNTDAALRFASRHGLHCAPEVHQTAEALNAPFDYDGTVDGLRGVPVTELRSVRNVPARGKTPCLADRLAKFGIESVYDLLMTIPRRYLDRTNRIRLSDMKVGETGAVLGRITKISPYDRTKKMIRFTVVDEGVTLDITFFRAPWVQRRFRIGNEVVIYGRLDQWTGRIGGRSLQMTNPIMDQIMDESALIIPIYPQSTQKAEVTTWNLHAAAEEAVTRLGELVDPFPPELVARHNLIDRGEAYRQIHAPTTLDNAALARTRLAFDELFRMQLVLGMRRHAAAAATGVIHTPTGTITTALHASLPYALTGAQQRAIATITADLARPYPMHRLLQGDVGSGKTLVASTALAVAVESGYQGALMAPTELLAAQLFRELADVLTHIPGPGGRPLVVEFLAARTRVKEKRRILAGMADGSVDIVVGTHALLVDDVTFANLGLVVVDEQHRFGVEQRAVLREKGAGGVPDMLVMTATPIPRTAAMTLFGDLDVCVLDELPPGRTPIRTTWLPGEPQLDVLTGPPWDLVRQQVAAGRQAYVVASLVQDNETIAAQSAESALKSLTDGALNGLRLGLVHGKQPREERDATMASFKAGDLDVLVATTVIEVGVNVPNATVMVILDATRFGIAQLHQIRGRVGRGAHESWCVLTGAAGSADATRRMDALVASTDGFYLSEVDLDLRGEGSIFGARQSGESDLRVASLRDDVDLIAICRDEATTLLDGDPKMNRRPGIRLEVTSALDSDAQEWLSRS